MKHSCSTFNQQRIEFALIQLLHDNQELAYYLGRQAAFRLKESGFMEGIDVLLPLPLHPSKKRKRGYNQAELITKGMASVLHLPIETTAVRRVVNTDTQTHKQVYERWQNVQQIFALTEKTVHLHNKHILIVDDVITTGSTMEACATTCLLIPEARVSMKMDYGNKGPVEGYALKSCKLKDAEEAIKVSLFYPAEE